jgi:hypothetical protein
MTRVTLQLQHFNGCPNHDIMRGNLTRAIQGIEDRVQIAEVPVENERTAAQVVFRGSPTLLINGEDLEGMAAPATPALACRFYRHGVPSAEFIRAKIEEAYSKD